VDLLHVVKPTAFTTRGNVAARQIVEQASQRKRDVASRRLAELHTHLPQALRGQLLVREGMPADVICTVAENGYEMVVLATNGRTGLSHTLLGSVAERVVRYSPVPVLVVR
jgi:nucleotide-binding universal stress UspA family protein